MARRRITQRRLHKSQYGGFIGPAIRWLLNKLLEAEYNNPDNQLMLQQIEEQLERSDIEKIAAANAEEKAKVQEQASRLTAEIIERASQFAARQKLEEQMREAYERNLMAGENTRTHQRVAEAAELDRQIAAAKREAEVIAREARRKANEDTRRQAKEAANARVAAAKKIQANKEEAARVAKQLRNMEVAAKKQATEKAATAKQTALKAERNALIKDEAEEKARREAEEKARREAAEKVHREAEEKARRTGIRSARIAKQQQNIKNRNNTLKNISTFLTAHEREANMAVEEVQQIVRNRRIKYANNTEKETITQMTTAELERARGAFINRFPKFQVVLFKLLNDIYNALYNDESIRERILLNVSAETVAKAISIESIKEHLYRFYIKGGAAHTLLFSQKINANRYPFTNDIDSVLLINPDLSDTDFNTLHANMLAVIVNIITKFIIAHYDNSVINIEQTTDKPIIIAPDENTKYSSQLAGLYTVLNTQPFIHEPQLISQMMHIANIQLEIDEMKPIIEPLISLYNSIFGKQKISEIPVIEYKKKLEEDIYKYQQSKSFDLQIKSQADLQLQQLLQRQQQIDTYVIQYKTEHQNILPPNYNIINNEYIQNNIKIQQIKSNLELLNSQIIQKNTFINQQQFVLSNIENLLANIDNIILYFNKIENIKILRTELRGLQQSQQRLQQQNESQIASRKFNYKLFFNQAYRVASGLEYLNQTVLSIMPRISQPIEILDIVLPHKNYKFIKEEWDYYTSRHIDGLDLNVQGPISAYIDQVRTLKGTPATQPVKKDVREKRLAHLNAQIKQATRRQNVNIVRNVAKIKEKMNEATFTTLFPIIKGGSTRKLPRWFHARKN